MNIGELRNINLKGESEVVEFKRNFNNDAIITINAFANSKGGILFIGVALKIPEYPIKPVSIRGRYYKRIGNSNHLLDLSKISNQYLRSTQNSWDACPYIDSVFSNLNVDKIKQFVKKVNEAGRFHLLDEPIVPFQNLEC